MNKITKDELRDRLGNIDQIRDVIFGAQLRDYDERLSQMESNLVLLQQEMRDRLEQTRTSFAVEIKNAIEALDKRLRSANLLQQEEAIDLRQQADRMNRKFASSIQALDETMATQISTVRSDLLQTQTMLQDDVSALRDLVLEELERRFSDLRTNKISKDDFADALFEIGMRMKGTEVVPHLREAASEEVENVIPLLMTRKMAAEVNLSV